MARESQILNHFQVFEDYEITTFAVFLEKKYYSTRVSITTVK